MTIFFSAMAWGIVVMAIASVFQFLKDGSQQLKKLHQIPCSNCAFFTGSPCIKCTVQPHRACTELAIGCRDFEISREG
jgi:hypothetical protein